MVLSDFLNIKVSKPIFSMISEDRQSLTLRQHIHSFTSLNRFCTKYKSPSIVNPKGFSILSSSNSDESQRISEPYVGNCRSHIELHVFSPIFLSPAALHVPVKPSRFSSSTMAWYSSDLSGVSINTPVFSVSGKRIRICFIFSNIN